MHASEIELRAKRKLGEVLKITPKNPGTVLAGRDKLGGTKIVPPKNVDTYKQIGIDKKLAAEAQKIRPMYATEMPLSTDASKGARE